MPLEELLIAASREKIDFDWLLTGEGYMYKNAVNEPTDPITQLIIENARGMTEEQKRSFADFILEKKRLNELEKMIMQMQKAQVA